ncbi:acetyl-CoA hydrolase/transferase C-terminal domain-containing protein [Halopiger djelfimassiliensis]|uniref:acetyl-CoA hydrolase/transferase C-terminal domain-containing protein n=1 Tax=Halopiger djelfimassiliensis TaxID=1293047 RepID=UPI000677B916|nr:acetyl-CoA hydrolase/transferase C-terminal domain-containing protein [Halopiger djelfimassiliensis]
MTNERIAAGLPVVSAEEAAATIPADATVYAGGIGAGPKELPLALARSDRELSLSIVSSADAGFLTDTQLVDSGGVDFRYPFAVWPDHRRAANDGDLSFVDDHFSSISRTVQQDVFTPAFGFDGPTVAIVEAVAVEDDRFVPTTAIGAVPAFVDHADRVIVEVNEAVPRTVGEFHDVYRPDTPPREPIPLSDPGDRLGDRYVALPDGPDAVIRTEQPPMPYPFRELTADEGEIAAATVDFLERELERNPAFEDRLTIEVGIGTLGDEIMRRLDWIARSGYDLAYYGEVIQDGLLELLADGTLESASGTGIVLSQDGIDRLYGSPETFADRVRLRPVDISNEPSVIRRLGLVGVNSALEVDIYGNANSSHVRGSRLLQGIGGSGDFTRNALVSVIVLPSTARDGEVSRIVPKATHVDHPDHDVDVVVTEHGVADLRGLAPHERATRLIGECAHPAFRDDLRSFLERATSGDKPGHVPHDLSTAFDPLER